MTLKLLQRTVPITNLGMEYKAIRKALLPKLERIFLAGSYILGEEVRQFEIELASYIGTRYAVGVNSGTDAILLALRALNIKAGDEVIVPAVSFFATVEPVLLLGAKPVFSDIDPVSYALDVQHAEKLITSKTKAIIAVHLYGLPADLSALSNLAKAHRVPLIEDMAQAIGSSVGERKAGAWGDLACLSFYPTKNLGACGDAGAVLTSSSELNDRLRVLRNHGAKVKYHHEEAGYNSRLDEIQAAILRLKLKHLDAWNAKRVQLSRWYTKLLNDLPLTLPKEIPGRRHIFHLYTIQSDRRDALMAFLQERGIQCGLHYPTPLHLLPALRAFGYKPGDFPHGESLARKTLCLPLYVFMAPRDVQYVADMTHQFFHVTSR